MSGDDEWNAAVGKRQARRARKAKAPAHPAESERGSGGSGSGGAQRQRRSAFDFDARMESEVLVSGKGFAAVGIDAPAEPLALHDAWKYWGEHYVQYLVRLSVDPVVEHARYRLLWDLRVRYNEYCNDMLLVEHPKESFNRWWMERTVSNVAHSLPAVKHLPVGDVTRAVAAAAMPAESAWDPLLPPLVEPEISPSLVRELTADIPCKLPWILKSKEQAIDALNRYITAVEAQVAAAHPCDGPLDSAARASLEGCVGKIRASLASGEAASWTQEDVEQILVSARATCDAPLRQWKLPTVQEICRRVAQEAADGVVSASKALQSSETADVVGCERSGPLFQLTHKGEAMSISTHYFYKLKEMYEMHTPVSSPASRMQFYSHLWVLLSRYRSLLGGLRKFEGSGLQAAVPPNTFAALHRLFGVTTECFASPFNCYFRHYCSAFDDTDWLFGSLGSFMRFHPLQGSFEANPPFSEELMEAMVVHIEKLLAASDLPLSFIVFIPEWVDPPTSAAEMMSASRFLRRDLVVPAAAHQYNSNDARSRPRLFQPVHGTHIFFLQNDAGAAKYTATDAKVDELVASMAAEPERARNER